MFYSDPALADLFSLLDWQEYEFAAEVLNSEQIEQMRGRLGLRKANEKFTKRFTAVEDRLHARGRSVHDASLEEMEIEWQLVKEATKGTK